MVKTVRLTVNGVGLRESTLSAEVSVRVVGIVMVYVSSPMVSVPGERTVVVKILGDSLVVFTGAEPLEVLVVRVIVFTDVIV